MPNADTSIVKFLYKLKLTGLPLSHNHDVHNAQMGLPLSEKILIQVEEMLIQGN